MLKRPWQIWALYALSLMMVLPAMAWLTRMALDLDRAEAAAQQQAELEEAIGSALWQIDTELTRLLATEVARPAAFYRSVVATDGKQTQPALSPLMVQPSPLVLLHFELDECGNWQSPQCPTGSAYELALANNAPSDNIALSNGRLDKLAGTVDYARLLEQLPEETVETKLLAETQWANNNALMAGPNQTKIVMNTVNSEPVQQQLETFANQPQVEYGQQFEQQSANPNGYGYIRNQRSQSRRQNDLQNRDAAFQGAAQQAIADSRLNFYNSGVATDVQRVGVSQALWVGNRLLLARRMQHADKTVVQGCWLDWPEIRKRMLDSVSDTLPGADLEPVVDMANARLSRVLASLPAQLVIREPGVIINPLSPIRMSLVVAWFFLLLATIAVAVLLKGVIALSERRASFVSAVTHELRTPLTTFRMYAEMLAEGMVADEHDRQSYLTTLQVEADRLSHLVENVLQYSRLERGASGRRRESIAAGRLLDRVEARLTERAEQAGMNLCVEADAKMRATTIVTDASAVEQVLFNLVDNACKYAVAADDRRIHIMMDADPRAFAIRVKDHGPGIAPAEFHRLFLPFSKSARDAAHSAPGVGLGLALCRRLAHEIGGKLLVERQNGGATFLLTLPL